MRMVQISEKAVDSLPNSVFQSAHVEGMFVTIAHSSPTLAAFVEAIAQYPIQLVGRT